MGKYSDEFKENIVKEYLAKEGGYLFLAKKYGITSKSVIQRWVQTYLALGLKGLQSKQGFNFYSMTFKDTVVKYSLVTGASAQRTANKFGISQPTTVAQWINNYKKKNTVVDASKELRRMHTLAKYDKENLTKEQSLEKEIELLRAEVAYIKKLLELGMPVPATRSTKLK